MIFKILSKEECIKTINQLKSFYKDSTIDSENTLPSVKVLSDILKKITAIRIYKQTIETINLVLENK